MTATVQGFALTPANQRGLNRVVRLAQRICDVPMALFSTVGETQVTFQASAGLPPGIEALPLPESFCRIAVGSRTPLVVPDATLDDRFSDLAVVRGDPGVRFYAAQPLGGGGDRATATLSVLDTRPRELTDRQISALADLAGWVESELERDLDLREAGNVQQALLPLRLPTREGYEFAGLCMPARDIGGDFFDYRERDGVVQMTIADVASRGIGAGILAATVRAALRAAYRPDDSLAAMVARAAESLLPDLTRTHSYATLFVARLHSDGSLEYLDAGHGLSWIVGADSSSMERLSSAGMPLGIDAHSVWASRTVQLAPDETVLAISDGVLQLFFDRFTTQHAMLGLLASAPELSTATDSLRELVLNRELVDDVSLVAIRRRG